MNVVYVLTTYPVLVDRFLGEADFGMESGDADVHVFATASLLEEYITKMDPRVRCDSFISSVVT